MDGGGIDVAAALVVVVDNFADGFLIIWTVASYCCRRRLKAGSNRRSRAVIHFWQKKSAIPASATGINISRSTYEGAISVHCVLFRIVWFNRQTSLFDVSFGTFVEWFFFFAMEIAKEQVCFWDSRNA